MRRLATSLAVLFTLTGAPMEALASPVLSINRGDFSTCDNDWTITVTSAAPYGEVYLEEWSFPSGSGNPSLIWAGVIGYTDGNGFFQWTAHAPVFAGFFATQVFVAGAESSPVNYRAYWC